ncbi:hypothetical protein [Celeribacter halophilus]|uniref:hypothetical protein n=1 Tax=Celeribacter halophilus TaxID=576117 RepID=UPI003A92B3A6
MLTTKMPLSIIYETEGVTPVSEVINALTATDILLKQAIELLPSLYEGLEVTECSLNVLSLTQQSPLKELFIVSLIYTFQEDLEREIPKLIETCFKTEIGEDYDTILTVLFMTVVFYGTGLAIDAIKRVSSSSLSKAKYEELVRLLAAHSHKTPDEIKKIINAKFSNSNATKKVISNAKKLFSPSKHGNDAPLHIDRALISEDVVREIPFAGDREKDSDFDRFEPYDNVEIQIHAMDLDKSATGWAAVIPSIIEKRMKLRVMPPLTPQEVWGASKIRGDVVIVEKFTANGYQPNEIQLIKAYPAPDPREGA